MSKEISRESILSTLPSVLRNDDGMYSLAKLIGWIVEDTAGKIDSPSVFQNINEADEAMLDLMAKDNKVDWYDYDADIETKRRQISSNWNVRKQIGTVGAVKLALQKVWPDTTVEEWFEYDGEPGYFRVLLGLDTSGQINFTKAVRMIDLFKPVRAHVDGYPILRIRCGIVVLTKKSEDIEYHVPITGTVPQYSTHGDKSYEDIVIETAADGPKYLVPVTGQVTAGTHPDYSTHGDVGDGGLNVGASSVSANYSTRRCGTPIDSLF